MKEAPLNMEIEVSVVIPCYNSAAFVGRAIESVLKQSFSEWELLLVDNGSTDDTLTILQQYAASRPDRITVLKQPTPGAPAARNMGLYAAKGKYIQFLDSDDELFAPKLAEQVSIIKQRSAALVAGNSFQVKEEDGQMVTKKLKVYSLDKWVGLSVTCLGRTSSCLFDKKAVLEAGGWNEKQRSSQEYELIFRMMKNGGVVAFSEGYYTTIYLRKESVHMSTDKAKTQNVIANYINLRKDIRRHLQQVGLWQGELKNRFNRHMLGFLLNMRDRAPELCTEALAHFQLEPSASFYFRRWINRTKRKYIG